MPSPSLKARVPFLHLQDLHRAWHLAQGLAPGTVGAHSVFSRWQPGPLAHGMSTVSVRLILSLIGFRPNLVTGIAAAGGSSVTLSLGCAVGALVRVLFICSEGPFPLLKLPSNICCVALWDTVDILVQPPLPRGFWPPPWSTPVTVFKAASGDFPSGRP